jgi:hypothetical protein
MAKNKYIDSPDKLLKLFKDYVKYETDNPMYKVDYVGKEGRLEKTPCQTPITFEGFEVYLFQNEIINDLGDYASNKDNRYSDYATIITYIRKHCFVHNFKGAAVKLFDPNLIARKLGLKEQVEQTNIEQPLFNIDANINDGDK